MLILDRNTSDPHDMSASQDSLGGVVDKRHHPVLILNRETRNSIISQTVVCRGATEAKVINRYMQDHWVMPTKSHSLDLERKVVFHALLCHIVLQSALGQKNQNIFRVKLCFTMLWYICSLVFHFFMVLQGVLYGLVVAYS